MGKSVIIVGGGAFGISAAWHLSRELGAGRKYTSIQVLDKFPPPSVFAAATDINKVIRTAYSDPVYGALAMEAMRAWTDSESVFQKHFHPTGWLVLTRSNGTVSSTNQSAEAGQSQVADQSKFMIPTEVQSNWPVLNGPMEGLRIFSDPAVGWAASGKVILELATQCASRGVSFVSGRAGDVQRLLLDENEACKGVTTLDGATYLADSIILTAGASTALILDMVGQHRAMGHIVFYIQLHPEEVEKYHNMPLVANTEEGCIFPPDENGIIKIASTHLVTNFGDSRAPGVSVPILLEGNPRGQDPVPDAVQDRLRRWLRQVTPELADRLWSDTRVCWDTETPNNDFVITKHPQHKGLVVASGGSGHGFKFIPTIGSYVSQLLDGNLADDLEAKWRWGASTASTIQSGENPLFSLPDFSAPPRKSDRTAKL